MSILITLVARQISTNLRETEIKLHNDDTCHYSLVDNDGKLAFDERIELCAGGEDLIIYVSISQRINTKQYFCFNFYDSDFRFNKY